MTAPHLPYDWRAVIARASSASPDVNVAAASLAPAFGIPLPQAVALIEAERARLRGRICL